MLESEREENEKERKDDDDADDESESYIHSHSFNLTQSPLEEGMHDVNDMKGIIMNSVTDTKNQIEGSASSASESELASTATIQVADQTTEEGDSVTTNAKDEVTGSITNAADDITQTFASDEEDQITNIANSTQAVVTNTKDRLNDSFNNVSHREEDDEAEGSVVFDATNDQIKDVVNSTQDVLSDTKDKIVDKVDDTVEGSDIVSIAKDQLTNVANKTDGVASYIESQTDVVASNAVDQTKDSLSDVKEKVSDSDFVNKTQDKVSGVVDATKDGLSDVEDKVSDSDFVNKTQDKVSVVMDATKDGLNDVKDKVSDSDFVNKTQDKVSDVVDATKDGLSDVKDKVSDSDFVNKTQDKVLDVVDAAKDGLSDVKDKVSDSDFVNKTQDKVSGVVDATKDGLSDVKDKVSNSDFVNKTQDKVSVVMDATKDGLNDVKDKVSDSDFINKTQDKVSDVVDATKDGLSDVKDKVSDSDFVNKTQDKVSDVVDATKDGLSDVKDKVSDSDFVNKTQDKVSGVVDATKDGLSDVKDKFSNSDFVNKTQDKVSGVVDAAKDGLNDAKDKVSDSDFVNKTKDTVSDVVDATKDGLSDVKDKVSDSDFVNKTQDKVSDVVDATKDGLSDVKDKVSDSTFLDNTKDKVDGILSPHDGDKDDNVVTVANVGNAPTEDDDTGTKEKVPVVLDNVADKTENVIGGAKDLFHDVTSSVSITLDNSTKVEWYGDKNSSLYQNSSENVHLFGECAKSLFHEDSRSQVSAFPRFKNTRPILEAHNNIWRGGHTNNILDLIIGTRGEQKSYLTGVLVSAILVLIIFIAWMVTLMTLRCRGRKRVGFWSGRRQPLPPRLRRKGEKAAGTNNTPPTSIVVDKSVKNYEYDDDDDSTHLGSSRTHVPSLTRKERRMIMEEIEARKGLPSTYTFPINFKSDEYDNVDHRENGKNNDDDNYDDKDENNKSGPFKVKGDDEEDFNAKFWKKYYQEGTLILRDDLLDHHDDTVREQYEILVMAKQQLSPEQFWKRYEYRCGKTAIKRLKRHRQQQKHLEKSAFPEGLPEDEWEELYETKKKEELYMKITVVFCCVIVIIMAIIMAAKGIGNLADSLEDGKGTISYVETLLNGADNVVVDLASGIENFRLDVLGLLNRTNKELCPRLKPQGLCPRLMEVESCDFTVHVDFDHSTMSGNEIDVDRNISVDIANLTDKLKEKVGVSPNGTIDIITLLFPNAPGAYRDMVEFFTSNWTVVDDIYGLSDQINKYSNLAAKTEGQVNNISWVFYIAVAFDVFVALLVLCMIIHIVFGHQLPEKFRCVQRRCLFPLFIFCVSLSFIFAIAFLVASLVLADTCVNDPNEKIVKAAEYYMGDTIGADMVIDLLKWWLSQCHKEPRSLSEDHEFLIRAQTTLEQVNTAILGVTDDVSEFCGTTDPNFFADIIGTSLKYICGVIGMILEVGKLFKCKTWMPLYYNTVYNALCYNGIDGIWSIAATQFTTVLMACVILTFRAVFFELEIVESDNIILDSTDDDDSSEKLNGNGEKLAEQRRIDEKDVDDYHSVECSSSVATPSV